MYLASVAKARDAASMSIDNNLTCMNLKKSLILFMSCIPSLNLALLPSSLRLNQLFCSILKDKWMLLSVSVASSNLLVMHTVIGTSGVQLFTAFVPRNKRHDIASQYGFDFYGAWSVSQIDTWVHKVDQ